MSIAHNGSKVFKIGFKGFLIIVGFFAVKFVNELIYNKIIQTEQGSRVLMMGAIFVIILLSLSFIAEKVIKNRAIFVYGWIFIILLMILGTVFYSFAVFFFFFGGFMLYAFIGSEAQVINAMKEIFGLSRFFLIILSLLISILLFFYSDFIHFNSIYSGAIFSIETILALMASYSIKKYKAAIIMNNSSILMGAFFMIMSSLFLYLSESLMAGEGLYVSKELLDQFHDEKLIIMMFVAPFYFAGAMLVYLAIENKIIEAQEKGTGIDTQSNRGERDNA
ncbi:MAG: hypothetical protein ACD_79C00126G0002 [uncultured bacterium]|nr:MAG: hypothetical protein ACD_79C00126G0002 [uncultured bacterium]